MKRSILTTVVLFFIIIMPIIIWQITYIDEVVSTGEKYGFLIGENKQEVFSRIYKHGPHENWVAVQVGTTPKDFQVIQLEKMKLKELIEHETWIIFYELNSLTINSLKLKFHDNKLYSMHRHKQLFEFP